MMFVLPTMHRKSLSWNTLRAKKRAESRDGASLGIRGQENGFLRKPKDNATPPLTLSSSGLKQKAKVSMAAADFMHSHQNPLEWLSTARSTIMWSGDLCAVSRVWLDSYNNYSEAVYWGYPCTEVCVRCKKLCIFSHTNGNQNELFPFYQVN